MKINLTSDFVIHVGAAPPSVTLATASPVTSPQDYLTVDTEDLYHSDDTESDTTYTTEQD